MKKISKIISLFVLFILVSCIDGKSDNVEQYYTSKKVELRYRNEKPFIMNIYKDSNINNDDLKYLQNEVISNNLEILGLHNQSITDEGVKYIVKLKRIRDLGIVECQLTDKGMEYIGKLENIEELDLSNTKITDEGLKYLRNLKKLQVLTLMYTKIGDKGIEYIKDLPIRVLELTGTEVSDKSIPLFEQMKGLEELVIDETKISPEGAERLYEVIDMVRYSDKDFSRE